MDLNHRPKAYYDYRVTSCWFVLELGAQKDELENQHKAEEETTLVHLVGFEPTTSRLEI